MAGAMTVSAWPGARSPP